MKKIKILKTLLIPTIGFTAIGTIATVSTSCSPVVIVTGVSLDKESLALGIGESDTLIATINPENATDKSVTWSSSDSGVATVDNDGKVAAVSEGKATITVTTNDGGFTATCRVTVHQEKIIHVIGVLLNKSSLPLEVGSTKTLSATVLPESATDKSVTWSSSDSSVATVDNNGKVTAVKEGQATITVTTNDGGFTDTCQVTVQTQISVTGVSLDKKSLALDVGDYNTLIATVYPYYATDKSVTWSSSDSSVATVDDNGKVTAVSEGSAKIAVTTNDGGYEDYCDVTVTYTAASYICITANTDSILGLVNEGGNNPNLQYSANGKNWTTYSGTLIIPANGKIYLIGNNSEGWSQSEQIYSHFNINGNVSISGNVMSLLDNGTGTTSSIPNDYCFYDLFSNSAGITSVSENFLPATGLTKECYCNMFIHCLSLTTAPALPATTIAESCYYGMFAYCSSLTTVSDSLPATELANHCYEYMFAACTSLTTAPALLAITLAEYSCASMFVNCTSLTIVPDLLATNLDTFCCQSMFRGCESIKTMPALPATKLAGGCYSRMFNCCYNLETVPDLPATELAPYCYYDMVSGCYSLASIRLGYTGTADEAPEYAFSGDQDSTWVKFVAEKGIFYYTGTDPDPVDNFGFLFNWTHEPY